MNTFFENLKAAGAEIKPVCNGLSVSLCGHSWIFTKEKEELGFIPGAVSTPFSYKAPVVLVEAGEGLYGKKWYKFQHTIPLDGSKYKVFC